MNLNELLNEELPLIQFKYTNTKNDKYPKVKVLDFNYKGIKGQKTYGQRHDVLGFNYNYLETRKKMDKLLTIFIHSLNFLKQTTRKNIRG